ncbi:hypothetical protein PJF56_04940 [Roseofilum sp. BLCC_M91]|uniref:Uncharacterized protein n=1 Tax=Roseofilum halophilum BLCC-M91 TaxID=3022259 RepID=A0ABT7BG94_9CYAN|nr:hypothetical protein [Roseofilum halophilum]MDJ1178202.1 hypothetical protein [Roseofilum halophilum BLCC-M91]
MQPSAPLDSDQDSSPVFPQAGLSMVLSLSTVPVVLGVLALKHMGQFWQSVGQESEEIFRGDRLPLLAEPPQSSPNSNPQT